MIPSFFISRNSSRTGRAGNRGVSVLLFNQQQARDIVRIERDLGHGFKFDLAGPPSTEAALRAAARTSAIASKGIPDETAQYFKDVAAKLLDEGDDPADVVARCLAAISRRSTEVQSRSLITGEAGLATVEMVSKGRPVGPNDVMFTVNKLAHMSRRDDALSFDSDVGKIQANREAGTAIFDMSVEDAKKLVDFSADIDAGGATFSLLKEVEIERGRHFGRDFNRRGGGGGRGGWNNNRGGGWQDRNNRPRGNYGGPGRGGSGGYRRGDRPSYSHDGQNRRPNQEGRRGGGSGSYGGRGGGSYGGGGERGGYRGRYDSRSGGGSGGW